jgi:hypothetical protein
MSKAIAAAAEVAGAVSLWALPGLGVAVAPWLLGLELPLLAAGAATAAGAIAQALGSNQGMGVTTRSPAGLRQIVRGEQRIGGTMVYCSTTGSTKRQYNMVIVLATHPCEAIENLYLDGRQVFWDTSSDDNQTVGGYNFGGSANGSTYTGPNGVQYNFGGLVFCEAFYGKQSSAPDRVSGVFDPAGGYSTALFANDPTWAPANANVTATAVPVIDTLPGPIVSLTLINDGKGYLVSAPPSISFTGGGGSGAAAHAVVDPDDGSISLVLDDGGSGYSPVTPPTIVISDPPAVTNTPYLGGCTYVYLKIEADSGTFPQFPEIRFTVHGKNDIYDPRTSTRGYSTNWALHIADAITDPAWGLGDSSVNQDQLIAAANVCDEEVGCAAGSEARYSLHFHYDTSTAPGDVIQQMMSAAAGRLSRIGGEWYIWPAYWQGPSATFDANSLLDAVQWSPRRRVADLFNRVTGTYIAPNFPYNVAGDLYDSNGFWNGETQNNFPYSFQPSSYPQYAADPAHGYDEDVYLVADTPNQGAYSSANTYAAGAVVIYSGGLWQANEAVPASSPPGTNDGDDNPYWSTTGNYLPREIPQPCVLSISQAQRVAKIYLERNRQQGSGTLSMSLAALEMQPIDVIQFNFSAIGWSNKLLEISAESDWCMKLATGKGVGASKASDQDDAPAVYVQVRVAETDTSVYEWDDTTEELTPYDVPAQGSGVAAYMVGAPSGLSAVSDITTALVQPDGTVIPRIELTWTEDPDTYVTNGGSIRVQMTAHSAGAWADVLMLNGQAVEAFLANVVGGNAYDVRIAGVRPSGAQSAWVELDNIVCGNTIGSTNLTPTSLTVVAPPGTLTAATPLSGSSTIIVNPFTATVGTLSASCLSSGPVALTGLTPQQGYYVYYVDEGFAGGAITPIATASASDFIGKPGYYLIGSIVTPAYVAGSGTRYAPSAYSNLGLAGVSNGADAYDGNLSTAAQISSYAYVPSAWAEGLFEGFPSTAVASGQELFVNATVNLIGSTTTPWAITASIGGGAKPSGQLGALNSRGAWAATTAYAQWDTFTEGGITYLVVAGYTSGSSFGSTDNANACILLASGTGAAAQTTYSVPLPSGLDATEVSVDATVNVQTATVGSPIGTFVLLSEIYIQ